MLGLCSIAFAEELDPRWKWYSSTSYESEYFDTNTIEYDADSQIARVWKDEKFKQLKYKYHM